jgi:hypothetical protein
MANGLRQCTLLLLVHCLKVLVLRRNSLKNKVNL